MTRYVPFVAFVVAALALVALLAPWSSAQTPCQRVDLPVVVNLDDVKHVHLIDHERNAINGSPVGELSPNAIDPAPRLLTLERDNADGRRRDDLRGIPTRTGFDRDEYPRAGTTAEKLAALRPAFAKDGTVTAGNASGINDGAAALVVAAEHRASPRKPLARILSYCTTGVDPMIMGMGPVGALKKAADRAGVALKDLDLFELNEAFACQALAVMGELGMDHERTNVNGGAVALGHPLGASGAKLTVQLLGEMRRRKSRYGMVTMCVGGGQGAATIFENLQN